MVSKKCITALVAGAGLAAWSGSASAYTNPLTLESYCTGGSAPTLYRNNVGDDSPCVAMAVSEAEKDHVPLYITGGSPIYLMGGATVALDDITIYGDAHIDKTSGQMSAPVFYITTPSIPNPKPPPATLPYYPFTLGPTAVTVRGLNFYWPNQNVASATPVVYPALFTPASSVVGMGTQGLRLQDVDVLNSYDLLDYSQADFANTTIGNVNIGNSNIWAINRAFALSNVPEEFFIHDSLFSPGADSAGQSNLSYWYGQHGTWAEISGTSSPMLCKNSAVSMDISNVYIYGAYYGIRVLAPNAGTVGGCFSGRMTGGGFDRVSLIFTSEQNSAVTGFNVSNGYWYSCVNSSLNCQANSRATVSFLGSTTISSRLSVSNVNATVYGSVFNIQNNPSVSDPTLIVNNMRSYYCNTITSGYCWFISAYGNVSVANSQIMSLATGPTLNGVELHGQGSVNGDYFYNIASPLKIDDSTQRVVAVGNYAYGSGTPTCPTSSTVVCGLNSW